MEMTRRRSMQVATAALMTMAPAARLLAREKALTIILAPSNLGLRPPDVGHQPGTWRAPQTLMMAGLASATGASEVLPLERPTYDFDAQPGTRIRNGQTIRAFSLQLSDLVRGVLEKGGFPLVIGGDCSILLGNLYGLRRWGGRGLVHVDGHSDFYQMSDQDTGRLGSAAGMDLALASGRGEAADELARRRRARRAMKTSCRSANVNLWINSIESRVPGSPKSPHSAFLPKASIAPHPASLKD